MTSVVQSDIFFFISSIGFIILGIFIGILLFYCIRAVSSFTRILTKIESSMDSIGDATMDLIEDLRDNAFFRMFVHPKKKRRISEPK